MKKDSRIFPADRTGTILPYLPFSQNLNRFALVVNNLGAANANVKNKAYILAQRHRATRQINGANA
ncbi:MAG TPA: hypothetical protein DCZ94_02640 [Lentisphaeria bacterium]|nr:MAG: hypothetical protein A2X48_08210 [Lentisphaerae bacterium GWF2_49_21]HBC85832.1 hypothetical protein [Lentisphaeria bacterium]